MLRPLLFALSLTLAASGSASTAQDAARGESAQGQINASLYLYQSKSTLKNDLPFSCVENL